MANELKILAISYLYPNKIYPDLGIFVHNRLKTIGQNCKITVINPIPWFPFFFLFDRYKNYDKIPKKEIMDGITVFHPRFFIIPRFFKFIDAITFSMAVIPRAFQIKKKNIDLIDLHWTYPDLLSGFLLSRIFHKKYLVTVRGKEALNLFMAPGKPRLFKREYGLRDIMTRYLLKMADFTIVLSRELKELALGCGVKKEKIQIITNGIDTKNFYFIPQSTARKRLNLARDETIILTVGSLTYGKGFDRLLDLLLELKIHINNPIVYIIGSEGPAGSYKKELKRLCRKNKICSSVRFMGQVPNDQLLFWYNAADLFCLSSRSEGSPNVLAEALACGCPCVATQVGAVLDIMSSGCQGKIIPNQDAAVLPAIISVLETDVDRKKNSKIMNGYSWNVCAQKVMRVYAKLIQGRI